jgi:hypothetical protein
MNIVLGYNAMWPRCLILRCEDGGSVAPKRWYPTISLHGVTTQKTSTSWDTPFLLRERCRRPVMWRRRDETSAKSERWLGALSPGDASSFPYCYPPPPFIFALDEGTSEWQCEIRIFVVYLFISWCMVCRLLLRFAWCWWVHSVCVPLPLHSVIQECPGAASERVATNERAQLALYSFVKPKYRRNTYTAVRHGDYVWDFWKKREGGGGQLPLYIYIVRLKSKVYFISSSETRERKEYPPSRSLCLSVGLTWVIACIWLLNWISQYCLTALKWSRQESLATVNSFPLPQFHALHRRRPRLI